MTAPESLRQPVTMTSAEQLSEDSLSYLHEKRVPELMEYILRNIIHEKPQNVAQFVHDLTDKPMPPQIMIAGPPASGKGTQAAAICQFFQDKTGRRPVHISSGAMLRAEVEKGTHLGKIAQGYMDAGKLVPDSLITGITRRRLQEEDAVINGWLLDGFPRTKAQAAALEASGLVPDVFIVLDAPDDAVVERIEGRRTDPVTGTIYHVKFNPPPQDDQAVLERLVQRDDDTREAVKSRLEEFHQTVDGLLEFYASILKRVDANKGQAEVRDDVHAVLAAMAPQ